MAAEVVFYCPDLAEREFGAGASCASSSANLIVSYQLPLSEFTAARDNLAKRLRSEGDAVGTTHKTWNNHHMRRLAPLFLFVVVAAGGSSANGHTSVASAEKTSPSIPLAALARGEKDSQLFRGSGGTILFNSWATGAPHLWYAVRPNGSGLRLLLGPRVTAYGALARLSPDGRLLLFAQRSGLYVSASSGPRQQLLLAPARGGSIGGSFDWSPNGRRVAYADTRGVWVTNLRGTKRVLIVPSRGRGIGAGVTWSPRGSWIAVFGRGKSAGKGTGVYLTRIYLVHPNGTGLHRAGDFLTSDLRRLSWSPDDRSFTLAAQGRNKRLGSRLRGSRRSAT
jgi:Tol biopolymer transport system component